MVVLLVAVFIVLISSALCSGIEAALFSTPMIKVKQLADTDTKGAHSLLKIRENMNRPIAMIVILNNIANIVGSMVIGVLATNQFGSQWMGVFSAVLTFLVIIFSEIIPKTVGEKHSQVISLAVAKPVCLITKCMMPLIWIIECITSPFTKGGETAHSTNEREIRYLAQLGEEEGVIEKDELSMIQGVFQLNDLSAHELMTPRINMTTLNGNLTLSEAQDRILESQHSRIVITGDDKDDIMGVALKSELLSALICGDPSNSVAYYAFTTFTVEETQKADDILPLFQQKRQHLAVVRDKFGGVSGVLTLCCSLCGTK